MKLNEEHPMRLESYWTENSETEKRSHMRQPINKILEPEGRTNGCKSMYVLELNSLVMYKEVH